MESQTIGKLAEALAKAQSEMDSAKKDSINPHFKSKYADIASVIEAIREPLSKHGLCYVQYLETIGQNISLITKLMHVSGEWIAGSLPLIITKNDMQGFGSSLTYARRYSLSAMVGIAQDDDDGNTSSAKPLGWSFGEREKSKLRQIMKAFSGGKQIIIEWEQAGNSFASISEADYLALCHKLIEAEKASKADPQSFDNFSGAAHE